MKSGRPGYGVRNSGGRKWILHSIVKWEAGGKEVVGIAMVEEKIFDKYRWVRDENCLGLHQNRMQRRTFVTAVMNLRIS